MKIAFLCASLEPGRDGVGDYTTSLAGELRQQGHEAVALALADKYVGDAVSFDSQESLGSLPTLRLNADMPWSERIHRSAQVLNEFDPEWLSLQFVSYGFHPKGLIHGLSGKLMPLIKGRKLHVMFHEIWLCKELGCDGAQCAVGFLQRLLIRRFVQVTKPNAMHTSNSTYVALLNRNQIPVSELKLFGNVPVSEPGTAWMESQLKTAVGNGYRREAAWLFGFFGAIHPQWPAEPLLTHLHRAARMAGKKPVLLSIGRTGEGGLELWNRLAQKYSDQFAFVRLGEQSTERISEYLSFLDCGIATTPRAILGKSGTVAAMIEHGLPVIVNREDAPGLPGLAENGDPLLIACNENLESRLQNGIPKGPRGSRRPQVAQRLLSRLGENILPALHLI